jgi:ubiquinol-cytochrome c reductase cytochrome b subunit
MIVLGWAVTGYVLRWDQAGYWANRVEVGIAAGTPVIGGAIRALAIGGNEYGNLTLTRFYTLHVIVMPGLVFALVAAHIWLARRLGATARRTTDATRRWPAQTLRHVIAMAIVFAALIAYVVAQNGAGLEAPADPAGAYDARPLWYFRWLFELRVIAGSYEKLAALAAPAVVAGFLIGLPLVDRDPDATARKRLPFIAAVVGLLAVIGALTFASLATDRADKDLADRVDQADKLADRARKLAAKYGVPATGAQDVYTAGPMGRARDIFQRRCKGCHDAASKDRKGPIIGAGHGNREWLHGMLKAPSGDAYWGHTKLAKSDDAMKPVELADRDLDDLAELLYAQTGAADVDAAKRERGAGIFDKACTDCHAIGEGVAGQSAPSLGGLGSRDYYTAFIGNPKSPVHMGNDKSEMPRFDKDLSIADRDALATYLVWLRTATQPDLDRLNAL